MPTYSIDGPDGKTYSIDGPEGATRDQVIAKIKERQQTPPAPSRGVVDQLFGLTGPRYQLFPERAARAVGNDILEFMGEAEQAGDDPEKIAKLGPQGLKIASETYFGAAPGAAAGMGAMADAAVKARQVSAALPTTEAIKQSAKVAYKAVEDARLIASEGSVNGLVSSTRAGLDQRLITDTVAPRAFKAIEQLQNSGGDIAQIMGVRQRLGEIKPDAGADFEAAKHIQQAIDDYIEHLPPAEIVQGDPKFTAAMLNHARASWKSYAQLDQVQSALEIGKHRAAVSGTGANTQNAMRQRIRDILDTDKSRGYSPEAKEQLEDIVMGTRATNSARYIGKFAPSGPVSAVTTMGAALAGDLSGGRGMATAAAAAVAIPATIAKYLGTYLTQRQIAALEDIIRSESPLGQAATKEVESRPPGAVSQALEAATPALTPGAASALATPAN